MIAGPFKFMHHTHEFEFDGEVTVMKDVFQFSSPLGVLGRLVDKLVLDNYLSDFLLRRNQMIKEFAESGKWKQLLEEK
jgi:ligand-binding SRPBCC domain-containing protein